MLGLLSAVAGFVSPFLGPLVDYFKAKQQGELQLAMLKESNNAKRDIAITDAQAKIIRSNVEDSISARKAAPSYGNAILKYLAGETGGWMFRIVKGFAIWSFTLIELLNGLMRPYVIYLVIGMWASVKVAKMMLAYSATGNVAVAITTVWEEHDYVMVDYTMGFLFGSRYQLQREGKK
jgi:hypothetical protein